MKKNISGNPFFSIITCTYNSEKFLDNNLNSVKTQRFKDYEQIIIDGESTDRTFEIVRMFLKNDPKIKLFSRVPKGVSDAFNYGIKHSKGEYILFLNSDDSIYDRNVLRDISIFLRNNPKLDWVYGKINVVEENGKKIGVFPKWKIFQIFWKYLLKFMDFVPHQAVFMKRAVFEKFGDFDTSLKTSMDQDLWLRVASQTNWKFIDRIVSNYSLRTNSLSSNIKNRNMALKNQERVKARYLNRFELFFAKITDWLIDRVNKTYR